MAEPFKLLPNAPLVAQAAAHFARVSPGFDAEAFTAAATAGLDTLARWASDTSAAVRRLVSEGSRPRLPWGLRLQALVRDPSPRLPLLRAPQDDPSEYLRRSAAKHLNDIAQDHPALLAQWLAEHLPGAPAPRRALLRHASRPLIKAGGHTKPKVFKGWLVELAPGESRQLVQRHSMKAISARRYHPGAHALDLRINGQVVAEAGFELALG